MISPHVYYWLFRFFPKKRFSRMMGWLANRQPPQFVLRPAIRLYALLFSIDLSQFELGPFCSFNAFFTRTLRKEARVMPKNSRALLCPCDGRVIESGKIENGRMIQAKGRYFRIEQLLGAGSIPLLTPPEIFEGGSFASFYLCPADYHRFHSPCAAKMVGVAHLPGDMWTVSSVGVQGVPRLFARNERVIVHLRTHFGPLAYIPVAATGVGGIRIHAHFLNTNQLHTHPTHHTFANPVTLKRGEEIGMFEVGSTVIVLFPPRSVALKGFTPTQAVRLWEPIGNIKS